MGKDQDTVGSLKYNNATSTSSNSRHPTPHSSLPRFLCAGLSLSVPVSLFFFLLCTWYVFLFVYVCWTVCSR